MDGDSDGLFPTHLGYEVTTLTLDNGFKMHLVNDPTRSNISVSLKINAFTEVSEYYGTSFLAAQAIRLGSGNYPKVDEFDGFFKNLDANFRVRSSHYCVCFGYTIGKDGLDESLNRLSDAVSQPELPKSTAKLLQKSVSKQYQDALLDWRTPITQLEKQLYGFTIPQLRKILTCPDLRSVLHGYIARNYSPTSMTLVVVYNSTDDLGELIDAIEQNFYDIADQRSNVVSHDLYRSGQSDHHTCPREALFALKAIPARKDSLKTSGDPEEVTISRVYTDSDEKVLWLSFPIPSNSYGAEIYWDYLLASAGEGSLASLLRAHRLITDLQSRVASWSRGSEAWRRVIEIHLNESGTNSIELILSMVSRYISVIRDYEVSSDTYKAALKYRSAKDLHLLRDKMDDPFVWHDILTGSVGSNDSWSDRSYRPDAIQAVGAYLRQEQCIVIYASDTILDSRLDPSVEAFVLREEVTFVLPAIPEGSVLRYPDQPFALPGSLDLATTPDAKERGTGFLEVSKFPLVAQKWQPGVDVVMKLKLPLVATSNSAAGYVLARFLKFRLQSFSDSLLMQASVEYADDALDVTVRCLPDAVHGIIGPLFALLKPPTSKLAKYQFSEAITSLKDEWSECLKPQLSPNFSVQLEEVVGSRSRKTELRDLEKVSLGGLPSVDKGYFALLLLGNVRRLHTVETAMLIGQYNHTSLSGDPYRFAAQVKIPAEHFTRPAVVTSLLPANWEGSASLRAFDLGDYTPDLMAKAVAFASIAATVITQDLRIGNLVAPHVVSRAVQARGHIWLVFEIIGHKHIDFVESKVRTSLFGSMAVAFADIDEYDMVAARGRAYGELFEPRDTMEEEAERIWQPMYWAGEPYAYDAVEDLDTFDLSEMRKWYFDSVKSRQTRRELKVVSIRSNFPRPAASEAVDIDAEDPGSDFEVPEEEL